MIIQQVMDLVASVVYAATDSATTQRMNRLLRVVRDAAEGRGTNEKYADAECHVHASAKTLFEGYEAHQFRNDGTSQDRHFFEAHVTMYEDTLVGEFATFAEAKSRKNVDLVVEVYERSAGEHGEWTVRRTRTFFLSGVTK